MSHLSEQPAIRLADSKNYVAWFEALKSTATANRLWHLFDPEGTAVPLDEPIPPAPPTMGIFAAEGDPSTPLPVGAHALSTAQKKIWDSVMEHYRVLSDGYKNLSTRYNREAAAINATVTYIRTTVTPYIFSTCCQSTYTYHEWVANI